MVLLSAGCPFFAQRSAIPTNYNLPLTVLLRMDPSIAAAMLEYRNACGQPVTASIQEHLQRQLTKRLTQVFEKVQVVTGGSPGAADGAVDVALGFREVNLFVPRKSNKSYPATVTIGLDFSYIDQQGEVLHSKKLQSAATGEVEAHADSCDLTGFDSVAQETVAILAEGMAQQLGTAARIREQAQLPKTSRTVGVPPVPSPSTASAEAAVPVTAISPAVPQQTGGVPSTPAAAVPVDPPTTPTRLSFRTIIRDDNQNHVLEQQEAFSVEFEVKNEGTGVAQSVEIDLSGHSAIVSGLKSPVSLGSLQPGEVRRVAVDGKVGSVPDLEQAELICALRASANVELPSSKKFFVAIRPDRSDAIEVLSVDVDQLPKLNGKSPQSQAIGIAIGVGTFRDAAMPVMKFAAHDAEVMGGYFTRVFGIPSSQVKIVTDSQGLKDDLIEVFEQWLPKQGASQQTAYIYFSGRAVVDQETGAVSLLPFDGSSTAGGRVFSLARLQRALARASVKKIILMLDLSLEPVVGVQQRHAVPPQWMPQAVEGDKGRVLVMVGNSVAQEALAYQPGQHGLFTYFLLKGLRGAADLDQNGTVVTKELCGYVQEQVTSIAQSTSGSIQKPICVPELDRASSLGHLPLSKSR